MVSNKQKKHPEWSPGAFQLKTENPLSENLTSSKLGKFSFSKERCPNLIQKFFGFSVFRLLKLYLLIKKI